MAEAEELIRQEADQTISFGDYRLEKKRKEERELYGNLYYMKTFHEMTRLEINGKLIYESLPGSKVSFFSIRKNIISFFVESNEHLQITLELSKQTNYRLSIDHCAVHTLQSNIAGKISFGIENCKEKVWVEVEKI